jgi:seryl-tRNA synthetase|tara:strand:- start:4431 stop:5717 length:1287 start_codon:yes stop_codon:yes gene_type:complete
MLDIKLIREEPELIKERIRNRGGNASELIDALLECDEKRRHLETEKQSLQGERNSKSKEIGSKKKAGEDTSKIEAEVKNLGAELKNLSDQVEEADKTQNDLLLSLPNTPHENCPVGDDENANPLIKESGEKKEHHNELENHVQIAERLGLIDFEAGSKVAGSGFAVFRGDGAKLQRSLIQFLLDQQTSKNGYTEISPPFVVARDCMIGTGQLPKFEEDMYGIENTQLFLAPTAEVPVTNLERDKILSEDDLPIKYTAYTPCFRREAGSAGTGTRGLIRMHQFDKVELVKIVHPNKSYAELESLTGDAEHILESLGLHYRRVELCTGDIGFSAAKTYDLEVWAPGQNEYLEVSSCSNFEDYQARRMKLRFKDAETGKNRFAHTLNGSGTALPRLYVALLETYQQADGSIEIPTALRPYFGSDLIKNTEP